MHHQRWNRHKHLGQTRPVGWGCKEKHPLYQIWVWKKRTNKLCSEWLDFWIFVKEVSKKTSDKHRLKAINNETLISRENHKWVLSVYKKENTESFKEYRRNYQKTYRKREARKIKNIDLKRYHGITIDYYDNLLERQNGVCAICGQKERHKQNGKEIPQDLAVDHCHLNNKIRGLLCVKCNTGIGSFKDSVILLQKAIDYLGKNRTILPET